MDPAPRLLDASVLKLPVEEAIVVLERKRDRAVDPITIQLDVENGKYVGATVTYPLETGFTGVCRRIDEKYRKWAYGKAVPKLRLWRIEDERLAISAVVEDEYIMVRYLPFRDAQSAK